MSFKILVVSDIHGSYRSINRINAAIYNHEPDTVVICGDITNFGDREEAIDILEKIGADSIIGVTGNCDPADIKESFEEVGGVNLDMTNYETSNFVFAGISGSNYSQDRLLRFEKIAFNANILVLHSPPYGFLDEVSKRKHIGERGLLDVISNIDPKLVLSGHVHESRGIMKEAGTVYVNPGPAYEDNLAIVELGISIRAKLI
ncbi:MAG: metallophosphoesterase [Candidatus Saliniplasma sp.]